MFFLGAKFAGIKTAKFSISMLIALISIAGLAPAYWLNFFVPGSMIVADFMIPFWATKQIYNVYAEQAFWAAFGAITMSIVISVVVMLVDRQMGGTL